MKNLINKKGGMIITGEGTFLDRFNYFKSLNPEISKFGNISVYGSNIKMSLSDENKNKSPYIS